MSEIGGDCYCLLIIRRLSSLREVILATRHQHLCRRRHTSNTFLPRQTKGYQQFGAEYPIFHLQKKTTRRIHHFLWGLANNVGFKVCHSRHHFFDDSKSTLPRCEKCFWYCEANNATCTNFNSAINQHSSTECRPKPGRSSSHDDHLPKLKHLEVLLPQLCTFTKDQ